MVRKRVYPYKPRESHSISGVEISRFQEAYPILKRSNQEANPRAVAEAEAVVAPSNLSGTVVEDQVLLGWTDNSSDETAFLLQVSTSQAVGWNTLQTLPADTIMYLHEGNPSSTFNLYRIAALRNSETSSFATSVQQTIFPVNAPTSVTGTIQSLTTSSFAITSTWVDNSSVEDSVEIQSTTASSYSHLRMLSANTVSYVDTVFATGTYQYRVAMSDNGVSSSYGVGPVHIAVNPLSISNSFAAGLGNVAAPGLSASNNTNMDSDTAFSLSFWVQKNSSFSGGTWIQRGFDTLPGSPSRVWKVQGGLNGIISVQIAATAGSVRTFQVPTSTISLGTWHHVLMTLYQTAGVMSASLHVDGTLRTITASGAAASGSLASGITNGTIRFFQDTNSSNATINCNLDEVAFWRQTLSEFERAQLRLDGRPTNLAVMSTPPVSWWRFESSSVDQIDSNDLILFRFPANFTYTGSHP